MSIKTRLLSVMLTLVLSNIVLAETMLKPFVLAETTKADMSSVVKSTKQKLVKAGFEIAGEYSPYANAHIIVVTNVRLKQHAAKSEYGAYGAAQRITLTRSGDEVHIAFSNPVYMASAYRMKETLQDVRNSLSKALGDKGEYGSEKGVSSEELREYHYKIFMPYFDDRAELVDYADHKSALEGVEKALAAGKGGSHKVYRIDIPGKEESVFGVQLKGPADNECSGDKYIMDSIDFKKIKSTGHLPYEMIVTGKRVYALYAEFRIAINFPDLSMVGSNSFASIMCAPTAIKDALTLAAGGKLGG